MTRVNKILESIREGESLPKDAKSFYVSPVLGGHSNCDVYFYSEIENKFYKVRHTGEFVDVEVFTPQEVLDSWGGPIGKQAKRIIDSQT